MAAQIARDKPAPAASPEAPAPVGFSSTTPLPENQGIINTLLLLNQTDTEGFQAVVKQLQSMGALGTTGTDGGSGSGDASSITGIIQNLIKAGKSHDEVLQALGSYGITDGYYDESGVLHYSEASAQPVVQQSGTPAGFTRDTAGMAAIEQQFQDARVAAAAEWARLYPTVDHYFTTDLAGMAKLQQAYDDAAAANKAEMEALYPKRDSYFGPGPEQPWDPSDPIESARRFNKSQDWSDPKWHAPVYSPMSDYQPVPYSNSDLQPATQININNNTFQSRNDLDYLVHLVQNQL